MFFDLEIMRPYCIVVIFYVDVCSVMRGTSTSNFERCALGGG